MQCPALVKILVNEEVKDHTEDKEDVKIRFFLMRLRHKLIPGKIHMWHGVPCALWIINNWSIYIFFYQGKKKLMTGVSATFTYMYRYLKQYPFIFLHNYRYLKNMHKPDKEG